MDTQSPSDDFMAYVRLTGRLHAMIRDGTDESTEGHALREEMDPFEDRITERERAAIGEISEIMWTLHGPDARPTSSGTPRPPGSP